MVGADPSTRGCSTPRAASCETSAGEAPIMIKGFKDFILRGNVIDLAVAVVIGAAFTALVAAITSNLLQPVLNAFGGVETGSLGFYINPSKPESYVNISAIISAIITFLITALVVYFVFVAP